MFYILTSKAPVSFKLDGLFSDYVLCRWLKGETKATITISSAVDTVPSHSVTNLTIVQIGTSFPLPLLSLPVFMAIILQKFEGRCLQDALAWEGFQLEYQKRLVALVSPPSHVTTPSRGPTD